ncbi:MAG: LysR family transcriptional regulator [Limnohabitans sp.]|jgi:DNA-binding transcriptional LysR family regulator|uniref:LysR family transcriptional regulator n=1 Tax=Limnohabitans sp. TaxID=1907725 RepID=UPI0025DDD733|nr:LysR family transcriptional regulator [Limnohabitans sp.]MCO4089872.1 LysR family transcriptional regulator [Limnohabitans sp.]
MNVTFRQLRLFLALAETGSVSAAAKVMHVTQPTASMQLKELSLSVGLALYEVIGKKIYLTDAGKELAVTGRAMAQTWDAFEQNVDAAKGLSRGKLRVAVVSTANYFMPHLIGSFCNKHPAIDVSLEILNRDGVVQRLRENLDDLYIMSMPPKDMDLGDEAFMPNPIVVIAPSSDPLAKRAQVPLHELAQRRFIVREKGSGTRMAADQYFRKMKFRPDVRLELGSNEAVKESVAGGLGLGVVSRHALHGLKKENGVSVIDMKGFPVSSAWHIVYPASKRLSPLAQAFKKHMIHEVGRRKWPQA